MGKYEEALERAKKAVKEGMVSQSFVDEIFGVQESEDERITNCIEELLRKAPLSYFADMGTTYVECFAYLEKQKEQKPAEVNVKALLTADRLASTEMTGRLKERTEILENPEKYGLCKPAEWSEEDENALAFLHELISFGFTEKFFDAQTAADMRKWLNTRLKSLRPQPHWKPSEEQMEALRAAMEHKVCYCGCNHHALKSLYNDLKKLL